MKSKEGLNYLFIFGKRFSALCKGTLIDLSDSGEEDREENI